MKSNKYYLIRIVDFPLIFSVSLRKNQICVSVYMASGKVYNRGKSIGTGVGHEVFEIGDPRGWVLLYP